MKAWLFVTCFEANGVAVFAHKLIVAAEREEAQREGERWEAQFAPYLLNNYILDFADTVEELARDDRSLVLGQFCQYGCGARDRRCRCGDDS